MANYENYAVPSWAGKPPAGLHLDIYKEDKFIQKIMIDEKKCYLFGRNPELNDFRIDHSSCSRVHAALIYHKNLNLTFLVDLNSSHGTFIGSVRLEAHKPTVVQINSSFHFGASTRYYTLRERIKTQNIVEEIPNSEASLPESQEDLDNLTEYNTAHNRKISTLGISSESNSAKKGKRKRVNFNEEEIIINPEDIDPTIGKFRNMVKSTVIPMSSNKRMRIESTGSFFSSPPNQSSFTEQHKHILHHPIIAAPSLYSGLPSTSNDGESLDDSCGLYSSKFMPSFPNPAPEIDNKSAASTLNQAQFKQQDEEMMGQDLPKKKKYAKETWFGPKKVPKVFGDI